MKNNYIQYLLISFLVVCSISNAQYNGKDFGFSINYRYTTTSKIFLQPNSPDEFLRRTNTPIEDIWSYSGEFRYRLSESIILGLSVENIKKTENLEIPLSFNQRTNAQNGYRIIPVEISLYYFLPFSTDFWKFYMGGGFGYYWGEHVRDFNGISAVNISRDFAYGIQIGLGMDYIITDFLSAKFEMRFRDPEIEIKSKYSADSVVIGGETFLFNSEPFESKVNIDGATFSFGFAFHF
jgi:opacity protein-like surface antigen